MKEERKREINQGIADAERSLRDAGDASRKAGRFDLSDPLEQLLADLHVIWDKV